MKKIIVVVVTILLTGALVPQWNSHAQDALAMPPQFECEYDLTGETITIYHFGDISAVYTFITAPLVQGFEDAVTYFNEQGGICGAEIVSVNRDTGASQEAAQAIWDDFSERDDAYVMLLYMTEDAELLRQQAEEKQIPLLVSTASVLGVYGEDGNTPGWVFGITPLYQDQLGAFCDYISENWEQFGIDADPVIGHVSWLGAFGQSTDTDATRAYCESKGIGYAGAEYYFPIVPDITTQIQNVVAEGANILYTTSVADGPSRLATTAAAMELPIGEEMILAGPNWVLDNTLIRLAGESGVDFIGQLPYVWWDEVDHPGIQVVQQYWLDNYATQNPETVLLNCAVFHICCHGRRWMRIVTQ